MIHLLIFLLMAALALLLTGLLRYYALSHRLIDIPNERSSHTVPTPRGGGIAIVLTFFIALPLLALVNALATTALWALLGAGALVAVVGFLDDHRHIPARWRLLAHFIGAGWALVWLGSLPPVPIFDFILDLRWLGYPLTAVYIVWLLNLFNFMDGIDGIAASEAVFIAIAGGFLTWSVGSENIALIFAMLAAATLGFWVWNWPPAKIFMGDVGSGFLGITLGILAYAGVMEGVSLWSWLILFGVFFVDATVTLLRRFLKGERWYEAHRSHAYQHVARKWKSHLKVTLTVLIINIVWLFPLACLAMLEPYWGILLTGIAYFPLIILALLLRAGLND